MRDHLTYNVINMPMSHHNLINSNKASVVEFPIML